MMEVLVSKIFVGHVRPVVFTQSIARWISSQKRKTLVQQIYSEQENKRILHVLNNESAEQLRERKIGTKKLQERIIASRPFESLAEVLSLPRINIVQVEKLCTRALMDQHAPSKAHSKTSQQICYPSIESSEAASIKMVTSLVLGGRDTSWVTMTDELEFIQARKMPYDQALSLLKYDHVKYTTTVQDVMRELPVSDMYVLPFAPRRLNGKTAVATAYHGGRWLLDATFCSLIAGQHGLGKVCTIRSSDLSSIFNLNVGGEVVKTDTVLNKILKDGHWKQHHIKELDALQHQRKLFDEQQSLLTLQCLAFITEILLPLRSHEGESDPSPHSNSTKLEKLSNSSDKLFGVLR
ncbi:TEFM [Bugula neritina]|uniref:TEFM n=1 Tax=Bugula neritina TaxID=10212 RepID=A0A7J7K1Z3_BUGNE|nr:TEFM [Bugula neritina]